MIDIERDLGGQVEFVSRRHHNQDIHIAIVVRLAVCVRPEEDDFFGPITLGDSLRELANQPARNVGAAIPARQARRRSGWFGRLHARIIKLGHAERETAREMEKKSPPLYLAK
jgi:hypothetical protein